ncbi:MAG TPA: GFA family protein [Rhizomicrobium sp.]
MAIEGGCHCRICQLTMGAPLSAYASVALADFSYTKGTPKLYRSSDSAARAFCGDCGAQLTFRRDGKERLGVNIVTLDDPSLVEPTMHIWTQSRIAWFDTADSHERREQTQPVR